MFRDGGRELSGPALLADLSTAVQALLAAAAPPPRRLALDALLRAGELECALSDSGDPGARSHAVTAARITDATADALLGGERIAGVNARLGGERLAAMATELVHIAPPALIRASRPEGFAYYALHPLDFARLAATLPVPSPVAGVLGVRTIGATLSAVVAAVLRGRGLAATRLTVRPTGHPFDRKLALDGAELAWVRARIASGAELFVVDEGPGLSGSTFLAVGEALVAEGARADRITLLCSRPPDLDALVAPDAARRARCFRWRAAQGPVEIPPDAGAPLGGGAWRERLGSDPSGWPSSWPAFERLKYLSRDGQRLLKFEGLGQYGAEVQDRARRIAEGGFGPPPRDEGDGFASYPLLPGRPLSPVDLSIALIERLADYCAFRAAAFPFPHVTGLEPMIHRNFAAEFGRELDAGIQLDVVRPVTPDGRMMPHEFLPSPRSSFLKVDAASHGDDHFFPGPTDIAWDLAGAIVEWCMDAAARRLFLRRYRGASGDRAQARLRPYLLGYTLHRLALTRLAADTTKDPDEGLRLARDHADYRALAERLTARPRSAPAGPL